MMVGESMMVYVPFFKVIVIAIDVFESKIIDERHFPSRSEANGFAYRTIIDSDNVRAIVVEM